MHVWCTLSRINLLCSVQYSHLHTHVLLVESMHFYAYYSSQYITSIIIFFMIRVRPSVCLFAASVALFQSKPSILILRAVSKLMIDHCECILISDMMISTGSRSRDPCFPRIIGFVSSARQQRLNRYLRRSFVFGKSWVQAAHIHETTTVSQSVGNCRTSTIYLREGIIRASL